MRTCAIAISVLLAAAACAEDTAASPMRVVTSNPTVGPTTTMTTAPTTTTTATTTTTTATATTATPTTAPTTTITTTTATTTTTTATTTSAAASGFSSSISPVTADELGESWREGCPVPVTDLRAVSVTHWNDGGVAVDGLLVVHRDHADDVVTAFVRIFEAGFPIASMRPVSEFGADDDRSMAADNTSGFNCREIAGRPGVWSQHSYGTAIDINPLRNPFVRGSTVDPPAGAAFVDRTLDEPGLIRRGDAVTSAFAAISWGWGGDWSSSKDYQHFSASGR